ncbi:hypothetical protein GCM10010967_31960 [Dyadobacter beijingensis]|uniref:YdhG-like domain-containing protein n=1 Tax=Dyadobacter beijingensis TaxID=365489 RepID=A0ABQ2HZF9_9BACT|nr:DUF1801 domain-containing protein [Dyadobacter beijingensis]GGM96046.1 hypothetical protein GCM10010967_31960 [Dyadobacter beijingensis]
MKNEEVTRFLDGLDHPLREEIEILRQIILDAVPSLAENVKWNGPNYSVGAEDRVTMKIQPPKQIQLIFHRGAKVKEQPQAKLLPEDGGLLDWKANDRAVASFKNRAAIDANREKLSGIVREWMALTLEN